MFPKLLERHEVEKVTLLGRASIYRLKALGAFSRPIRLCRSALAWRATVISAWLDAAGSWPSWARPPPRY